MIRLMNTRRSWKRFSPEQAERLLKQHVMIQGEPFTDFMARFADTSLQATI